jgi:hypothetical protein
MGERWRADMDCRKITELIDNGEGKNNAVVKDHIGNCEKCSRYFDASLYVGELIGKYSPEMDDPEPLAFDAVLLHKLKDVEQIEKEPAKKWFLKVAVSFSLAAIAVVAVVASLFFADGEVIERPEVEPDSMFTAQIDEPVGIVIEYVSDEDIEDVAVSFSLDRGVRFHSDNESVRDLDTFIWKGSFAKGKNEIPFVVNIVESGKWEIMTTAQFNGYSHRQRITLDATGGVAIVKIFRYKPEKIGKET